jgi:protein ImuB
MWWIALHLPQLSFESWLAALPADLRAQPAAVMDAHSVQACNAAAQQLGVQPGCKRATALALAPQLQLGRADAARDRQVITSVAHVALAFTPAVTFALDAGDGSVGSRRAAPHTVLLQAQASLRYFGGPAALLQRLRAALSFINCTIQIASAPTAHGAALLSRMAINSGAALSGGELSGDVLCSGERHCADLRSLEHAIAAAPLWLLGIERAQSEALDGMGLHTIGQLQRMPRSGWVRRFGNQVLDALDRALGQQPDPTAAWVTLPAVFEARLELLARADTTAQVLHGAQLLIEPLLAWVRAQQAQLQRFTLFMHHELRHRADSGTPPFSELAIALARPSCDAAHVLVLLRERLGQMTLASPVLELRLHCAEVAHSAPPNTELFASARAEREGLVCLIERLQSRLGAEQIQRLALAADHRPEHGVVSQAVAAGEIAPTATRRRPVVATAAALCALKRSTAYALSASRPAWLLQPPQRLLERQSRPVLDGQPLQLLCGPERVESGWWDALLAERDYFVAQTRDGALVWIYRARLPLSVADDAQGWFLHGRFA